MADEGKETVLSEELQNFLRQGKPELLINREKDKLDGHFLIQVNEPLPQYNSSIARAFAVRDSKPDNTKSMYALVFENDAIIRHKTITSLKGFVHPNIVTLMAEGVVELSLYNESRYVVVLERPLGQPLSSIISAAAKNPQSEGDVVNFLLRPMYEIIKAFSDMGISHNRINPNNIYLNNGTIQLGECVSEPPGLGQDFVFEPIERLLANPRGNSDQDIKADCYAVGLVALHMLVGFQPFEKVQREEFIAAILAKGTYHALVIQWETPASFQDLFRALLNNLKNDRCTPDSLDHWLSGRRFNLILPSVAVETGRPFEFCGSFYSNRKSLAAAMFANWEEAKLLLQDTRLARWLDNCIHKKDLGDAVMRLTGSHLGEGGERQENNKFVDETITRIITILDPEGPLRFKTLSLVPEGAGNLLAYFYLTKQQQSFNVLKTIIDNDLFNQWMEPRKGTADFTAVQGRLSKIRGNLRQKAHGFGAERCVYDAQPYLVCQSPLLKRMGVSTLKEILVGLDMLAYTQKVADTDFVDVHVSAILASRLAINKELSTSEIDSHAQLRNDARFVAIKILAKAQSAARIESLKGLTCWVAIRMGAIVNIVHRRSVRSEVKDNLRSAALSGNILAVASVLMSADILLNDFVAFKRELAAFAGRKALIARLRDPEEHARNARMLGRAMSQVLAYGTCLFTVYFTIKSYYNI